jgi:hypothetical protein
MPYLDENLPVSKDKGIALKLLLFTSVMNIENVCIWVLCKSTTYCGGAGRRDMEESRWEY